MSFVRNWVVHNWALKLLALLISFLLWSAYSSEPNVEVGHAVPLEFRNLPPGLEIVGEVPSEVHVRLRGRTSRLRRLTSADLAVRVDLAGSVAGETLVRITSHQVHVPPGVELVRIAPAEIRMRLAGRPAAR